MLKRYQLLAGLDLQRRLPPAGGSSRKPLCRAPAPGLIPKTCLLPLSSPADQAGSSQRRLLFPVPASLVFTSSFFIHLVTLEM